MDKELIILAIYINVEGKSRAYAEQAMFDMMKQYEGVYDNVNKEIKTYILPSNETKVQCVYPPSNNNGDSENELLKVYKLLLANQPEEAKEMVRAIERKLKLHTLTKKT